VARNPPSPHFTVERLAPGVHAAIATRTGTGLCNSGIVDLGGASVVFDSMLTPAAGEHLARAAQKLTGAPPTWVVNSHYHGDHIWGNGSFPASHVVSSRRVREVVLERSQQQLDACRKEFPGELAKLDGPESLIAPVDRPQVRAWFQGVVDSPKSLRIVPPEVTFLRELRLEGRRRALHLYTWGGGHSPSDVVGYLPDEKILFAGDLIMNGYHPSLGDGYPAEWQRILSEIGRLRIDRLLPGHGPVGDRKTWSAAVTYHRTLRSAVVRARRRGLSRSAIAKLPVPAQYRDLSFGLMWPDNAARVARELGTKSGSK
jgi:cyclase